MAVAGVPAAAAAAPASLSCAGAGGTAWVPEGGAIGVGRATADNGAFGTRRDGARCEKSGGLGGGPGGTAFVIPPAVGAPEGLGGGALPAAVVAGPPTGFVGPGTAGGCCAAVAFAGPTRGALSKCEKFGPIGGGPATGVARCPAEVVFPVAPVVAEPWAVAGRVTAGAIGTLVAAGLGGAAITGGGRTLTAAFCSAVGATGTAVGAILAAVVNILAGTTVAASRLANC